jgi:hypothetical protein
LLNSGSIWDSGEEEEILHGLEPLQPEPAPAVAAQKAQ